MFYNKEGMCRYSCLFDGRICPIGVYISERYWSLCSVICDSRLSYIFLPNSSMINSMSDCYHLPNVLRSLSIVMCARICLPFSSRFHCAHVFSACYAYPQPGITIRKRRGNSTTPPHIARWLGALTFDGELQSMRFILIRHLCSQSQAHNLSALS